MGLRSGEGSTMAAARMVWDGATMAADKMRAVEGLRLRVGGACAAEGCGLRLRGTRGTGWVFSAQDGGAAVQRACECSLA